MATSKAMPNKAKQDEYEPFDWESLSPQPVIGVDEVGRGCLAGPVYAAAVILKPESVSRLGALGVTDSKLLSAAKRELLAKEIIAGAWVGIGFATAQEIDEINILQATFLSMRRALFQLERSWLEQSDTAVISGKVHSPFGRNHGHLLIDGNQRLPMVGSKFDTSHTSEKSDLSEFVREMNQTTLIKGDLRALPIAAASIVAKVTRDRLMTEAGERFPEYGFEKHKGYAAAIHRKAIAEFGPIELHRKTFGGVKEFVAGQGDRRCSMPLA